MKTSLLILLLFVVSIFALGCASSQKTVFINPEFDFAGIERVAVVPFENLTNDQGLGEYMTRVFVTELLSRKVFDIAEPGEVSKFVVAKGQTKTAEMNNDLMKELGKTLNVQGIIFGTVGESDDMRSSTVSSHIVALNCRFVAIESGSTVWSASVNTSGPGFIARLFGVGDDSRASSTRKVVRKTISTLVK